MQLRKDSEGIPERVPRRVVSVAASHSTQHAWPARVGACTSHDTVPQAYCSAKELHRQLLQDHPEVKVSYDFFRKCRPGHVTKCNKIQYCVCSHCSEGKQATQRRASLLARIHHDCDHGDDTRDCGALRQCLVQDDTLQKKLDLYDSQIASYQHHLDIRNNQVRRVCVPLQGVRVAAGCTPRPPCHPTQADAYKNAKENLAVGSAIVTVDFASCVCLPIQRQVCVCVCVGGGGCCLTRSHAHARTVLAASVVQASRALAPDVRSVDAGGSGRAHHRAALFLHTAQRREGRDDP